MKSETVIFGRNPKKHTGLEQVWLKGVLNLMTHEKNMAMAMISFFIARASFAGDMMPFAISMLAAIYGLEVSGLIVVLFSMLGLLSMGAIKQIIVTSIAIIIFTILYRPFKKTKSRPVFKMAVIACVSSGIASMLFASFQGFYVFDILKGLLQSTIVFLSTFILRNAIPLILDGRRKSALSAEEMISIAIMVALVLTGFFDTQVFGFGIKHVLCILLVLFFSYQCGPGVGAALGVTAGLLVSMSSDVPSFAIGTYGFCGMLSGILRNLGKTGVGFGFVMGNAVLTLYLNGSTDVIIQLKDIMIAITLFFILPKSFSDWLTRMFKLHSKGFLDEFSYCMRIKEITIEKLNKVSKAFLELSKTFAEISQTGIVTDKQDISYLFDRVADKVCKGCCLSSHCWDRNFYNTYQVMFKIIEKLDDKGRVGEKDIPQYFVDRCERINSFMEAVNHIYELFRVDILWKNRIGESRELVSQQIHGLAGVVSNLAFEIDREVTFDISMENTIFTQLKKAGVKVNEVIVLEDKFKKWEISIVHKHCAGMRSCTEVIEKLVSEVAGRKMTIENSGCCSSHGNGNCLLKLIEEASWGVAMGMAKISKKEGTESGDSYTFMHIGRGKYIIALSDGMGSGHRAAVQSKAAVNLLEHFLESGFEKDTAVKLINSILVLKSSEDSFSTIDMSMIDLGNGDVEFVKIGAVPTLIKRADRVEVVRAASLPAGILPQVDVELMHKTVNIGDMIIMMTDGITDCFENLSDTSLIDFIQDIESTNPQQLADSILKKASDIVGLKAQDDMLVLVAKVWKKAG